MRLQVEQYDEEQIAEQEYEETERSRRAVELADVDWEQNKEKQRKQPLKELKSKLWRITNDSTSRKRDQPILSKRRKSKMLKFEVLEEHWGLKLGSQ